MGGPYSACDMSSQPVTWLPWVLKVTLVLLAAALSSRRRGIRDDDENHVQIVVLGDLGRSPRMQYHALSMARNVGSVELVGYLESDLHPDILATPSIKVRSLAKTPSILSPRGGFLFLLFAPLKVAFQTCALLWVLLHSPKKPSWTLVQNPPSIPTLAVCLTTSLWHKSQLVIDWHNFGYSILSLRLGQRHPLVYSAWVLEACFGYFAFAHICVSHAMARALGSEFRISSQVLILHDRPASVFQPLTPKQRMSFLDRLCGKELTDDGPSLLISKFNLLSSEVRSDGVERLRNDVETVKRGISKLVVSSTSWTSDEDFDMFLEALVDYSDRAQRLVLPSLLVIITGKGPNKADFESRGRTLLQAGRLSYINLATVYFDNVEDYARLLGAADLGVSLHKSSGGVDLPMKVLDMFGAGLPVTGWCDYEAWPELVQEGRNGTGFKGSSELSERLQNAFKENSKSLSRLRIGALEEGQHRWDEEWIASAGKLFAGSAKAKSRINRR